MYKDDYALYPARVCSSDLGLGNQEGEEINWSPSLASLYEGKSLNNRNAILKRIKNYAQGKFLFRGTVWLLSNMSYRSRDDEAV